MKTRVMRIIARLNVGGPAIHATLLSHRLDALGYDTLLVAGREGRDEGSYLDLHGDSAQNLQIVSDLGPEIHPGRDWRAYRVLVGIVARLVPIKAHEIFVAMAARVARARPDANGEPHSPG